MFCARYLVMIDSIYMIYKFLLEMKTYLKINQNCNNQLKGSVAVSAECNKKVLQS